MRTPVVVVSSVALATWMLAAGCGGDDGSATTEGNTTTSTGAGGSGQGGGTTSTGTAGGGGEGGQGAGTPYVCEVTPTSGVVLAIDEIFLGETNPDGSESADAWRQYGFNLDGLVSTESSMNLCQPNGGGMASMVYPDGNNGIDNSFGKNILPALTSLVPALSAEASAAITSGESTMLLYLEGLGQEPTQTMIPARVYTGARTEEAPAWDGADCRGVDPVSLEAGDIMAPTVLFPESLVVNHEWSGGAAIEGPLTLRVMIGGAPLSLKIHQVRVLFDMPPSHDSGVNGQLGGVLHLDELEEAFRALLGALDPALCEGSAQDNFINLLRNMADILADGSQDPAQTCNAVSIGIGFTMAPVQLGSIAPPVQVTDPCAP